MISYKICCSREDMKWLVLRIIKYNGIKLIVNQEFIFNVCSVIECILGQIRSTWLLGAEMKIMPLGSAGTGFGSLWFLNNLSELSSGLGFLIQNLIEYSIYSNLNLLYLVWQHHLARELSCKAASSCKIASTYKAASYCNASSYCISSSFC